MNRDSNNGGASNNNASPNNVNDKDKSWNDGFKKISSRVKQGAKNAAQNSKQKLEDKVEKELEKAGAQGKAAVLAIKGIKNHKYIQQTIKVMSFIATNIDKILISTAVVIVLLIIFILVDSFSQALGHTPHYYCDIDADKGVKRTALYQQYCTNGKSEFSLDSINGHYVVQDGSGPCTDCACLNLLIRYYTSKDVNIYNYLWDNTGQYIADHNALSLDTTFGNKSIRQYIAAAGSTTCTNKASLARGANWFAKKHPTQNVSNSNNFTKADWGFVRDETLSFTGLDYTDAIETDEAKNISTNDNWVWDLSCETTWSAQWGEGNYINIENITATWECPDKWTNKEELKDLLTKYPSGIVAYRNYGSGKHAILITSWNEAEQCFNVVDSAMATSGGFEGPATSSNFLIQSIWNESQIETCANVEKLVAIKEDATQ